MNKKAENDIELIETTENSSKSLYSLKQPLNFVSFLICLFILFPINLDFELTDLDEEVRNYEEQPPEQVAPLY